MDKIKQLTGKNPKEYETVASMMINNADVALFEELVLPHMQKSMKYKLNVS